MFSPEDEAIMRDLNEILDTIQQRGGMWGTAAYVAQRLIIELWRDVSTTKSCYSCKHCDECDPDALFNSAEQRMWATCRGSYKLNWEWRGVE